MKTTTLTFCLAQINPTVGALEQNTHAIIDHIEQAREQGVQLIVFPELVLTGYPPEDVLMRSSLADKTESCLSHIQAASKGLMVIVGHPRFEAGQCFNSLSVFENEKHIACYDKQHLPNYGVFDEQRYFTPGQKSLVVTCQGIKLGLMICEDGWFDAVALQCKQQGAQALIQINASPFSQNRMHRRIKQARARVEATGLPLLSVYQVGGQDELVFEGGSFVLDATGQIAEKSRLFEEDKLVGKLAIDAENSTAFTDLSSSRDVLDLDGLAQTYRALVLGVRDYIGKNGFPGVILGLSGGIDSALTLAVAVDALGKDKVRAVLMPSQYTAQISIEDAVEEAKALGVHYDIISIEPMFAALKSSLSGVFSGYQEDVTEENMQARCRGMILMAMSNKFGHLVLTTGNKSELAVGYSTLYGDMAGGFDVLKDVYKTQVYALSEYRNTLSYVIPERVMTRAPSAELRPDQTDQDSLPEYEELDQILALAIEQDQDQEAICQRGFSPDTVKRVLAMLKRSEYKRRQAPIGPKVTDRAFGRDWRQPVTSKWSG